MGFGYLTIGYLMTFVLRILAETFGLGGPALLIGCGVMTFGLFRLVTFHRAFVSSLWIQIPLIAVGCYATAASFSEWFGWGISVFTGSVAVCMRWIEFFLIILFQLALLYGIRMIAKEVRLPRIASAAIRNSVFVLGYAVVYLLCNVSAWQLQAYLGFSVVLLNLVWIVCDLFLLITCTKDICAEGDEEQTPKRYRWEFLNRIGDAYERNRTGAIERVKSETEERLKKKQEARNQKKIQHSKKKKR